MRNLLLSWSDSSKVFASFGCFARQCGPQVRLLGFICRFQGYASAVTAQDMTGFDLDYSCGKSPRGPMCATKLSKVGCSRAWATCP